MSWKPLALLAALLWAPAGLPAETTASSETEATVVVRSMAANERRSALSGIDTADDLILLERSTRSLPPVEVGPDDGAVALLTANLLARSHYLRMPLDDSVSSRFLDEYVDTLDNLRFYFLESDLLEFEKYRHELDDRIRRTDVSPGREIFERFLQRIEERVAYVGELLKNETFEFNRDDGYLVDRREAPRARNLEEAKALWRQHLRYEVLEERLAAARKSATNSPVARASAPATPAVSGGTNDPAATRLGPNGLSPDIVRKLTRRYARLLKIFQDFDGADVFQYYLSALTHVYDPHSDYMGKAYLENFAINMNLSLFGIGAVLQSDEGYCKVRELRPGPAMRSKKIKPGDRIVAVAQEDGEPVDVVDMKLNKVVELVRGPKGSRVRLTLIPVDASNPSERREVTLVRDEIKLEDEEAKARIIEFPNTAGRTNRIGLIDLPSFYQSLDLGQGSGRGRAKSTTLDVARLLAKLKQEGVQGLILDLRRNGGGSLEEAIDLTGLFIREGPIVQVRTALGRTEVEEDPNASVLYDGPLVVLTSRFSASASEILAGALQDYGRALIVGDTSTHGKGTVQSLVKLQPMFDQIMPGSTNNAGALKVTIRKFYRASGASTQLKGVVPDVVLPSVNNYAEVGESSLDHPLPWDEIPAAEYVAENRIRPALEELRTRSARRVGTDRDFDYVREDIETYRKHQADKRVSLNEEVRRREQAENEARLEARKAERKGRQEAAEVFYEITLKQVDLPGLPPPGPTPGETAGLASTSLTDPAAIDADAESEEDKANPFDPALKESKRILADLIDLSTARGGLVNSR